MARKTIAKLYNDWLLRARKTRNYKDTTLIKKYVQNIPANELSLFCAVNWITYSDNITDIVEDIHRCFLLWASIEAYDLQQTKKKLNRI